MIILLLLPLVLTRMRAVVVNLSNIGRRVLGRVLDVFMRGRRR